jgi:hypothetical protein
MQPEDRANADRLWVNYAQLAAVIRECVHVPDAVVLTTRDLLLMALDREHWKNQALTRTAQIAEQPAPVSAPPEQTPDPAPATAFPPPNYRPPVVVTRAEESHPIEAAPTPPARVTATPERIELLKKLWPNAELSIQEIYDQLRQLEGPPIRGCALLYSWAQVHGLPVPREYRGASSATQGGKAPPPAVATAKPAGPGQRAPITPADNLEEARNLLAAGMSVVSVAEETGLPKSQLVRMAEEAKAARGAGGRA